MLSKNSEQGPTYSLRLEKSFLILAPDTLLLEHCFASLLFLVYSSPINKHLLSTYHTLTSHYMRCWGYSSRQGKYNSWPHTALSQRGGRQLCKQFQSIHYNKCQWQDSTLCNGNTWESSVVDFGNSSCLSSMVSYLIWSYQKEALVFYEIFKRKDWTIGHNKGVCAHKGSQ